MGKHKHLRFMGFLNVSGEAEIHKIPKIWEKRNPIRRQEHGKKTKHYEVTGFFGWSWNPCNSRNIGKVNLLNTGKVWENTKISHVLRCLADLELMRTNAIPNVWECINSHKMEIFCGKPYHSQAVGFWEN